MPSARWKAFRNLLPTFNARGELRKIAGFGDAIVGKTQEILATGTCALYERLKAEEAAKAAPPLQ